MPQLCPHARGFFEIKKEPMPITLSVKRTLLRSCGHPIRDDFLRASDAGETHHHCERDRDLDRCAVRARLVCDEFGRHDAALDEPPVQVDAASRAAAGRPAALCDPLFHGAAPRHEEIACLPTCHGPGQPTAASAHHLTRRTSTGGTTQLQCRATARRGLNPSGGRHGRRDMFLRPAREPQCTSGAVGGNKMSASERAFTG